MLGIVFIRRDGEATPTRRQLLDRAQDALRAAHARAGTSTDFDEMTKFTSKLLESGELTPWTAEIVWLDDTLQSAVRVGLFFLVAARNALEVGNEKEFVYLISKSYYYVGSASGPATLSESQAEKSTARAALVAKPEQDAVLEWLKRQAPRTFKSMREAIGTMVREQVVSEAEGDVERRLYAWARRSSVARKAFSRVCKRHLAQL